MLASVAEHGQFLNKFASRGNPNFRSMQYHGLANLAAYWPEFLDASAWLETACSGIVTDVNSGVYMLRTLYLYSNICTTYMDIYMQILHTIIAQCCTEQVSRWC